MDEGLTPDQIDELARRAQDGDRDALETLLGAVRPRVLHVCRGVLPFTPDAEDACQEALLSIASKIGTWGAAGDSPPGCTWWRSTPRARRTGG
ncbi:MAG: hypothetical protein R2734_11430 [Nocardioides sp.]